MHVEADDSADIQGTFNGTIEQNDGLVSLHGLVDNVFASGVGDVVVGIDSIITDDEGAAVLRPDGSLDQLPAGTYGSNSFNIDLTPMGVS